MTTLYSCQSVFELISRKIRETSFTVFTKFVLFEEFILPPSFFFCRNLLLSYSATINYKDTHGVEASNNLVDKCITNIKKALESKENDENLIEMKVSNEFYMVLSRKPKN